MSRVAIVIVLVALLLAGACQQEEATPNRDYIPIIRKQVFALQEAVKERDRAAIDSLLSVQILQYDQDADSLLSFIYGPQGDLPMARMHIDEQSYTDRQAWIKVTTMDSTETPVKRMTLTFVNEGEVWLLKRFDPRLADEPRQQ